MDKELTDSLAQLLRQQRNDFLQDFRRAEEGLEIIAEERESELEEHAQEEQTARLLTRLDDRTLFAVKEIDAALERILKGAYGKCEACHKAIPLARLRSLPATRLCRKCAAGSGAQPATTGGEAETLSAGPAPADLSLLDDHELVETIRERFREDGRIDMEELHVVCRKGVVYLAGLLPSEAEHQIMLHTLTDVLGFKEIVDHLEVEQLLWQSEKRAKEKPPEKLPPWQESQGTEDIAESFEEGKEFDAPAKPTPEQE